MQAFDLAEETFASPAPSTPGFIGGLLRSGFGSTGRAFDRHDEGVHASIVSALPDSLGWGLHARIVDSPGQALLAQELVRKRYSRAGYRMVEDGGGHFPGVARAPYYFPIVALMHGQLVGTVTLGVDSPAGLMVDEAHKNTADAIRAKGGRLCELVRLAIEDDVDSKAVLTSLLQCVYTTCTEVFDVTDVAIEVVPQHAPFYCRLLGFTRASEIRLCERVGGVASLVLSLTRSELERRLRSLTEQ